MNGSFLRRSVLVSVTFIYITIPLALFYGFWLKMAWALAVVIPFMIYVAWQIYTISRARYRFGLSGKEYFLLLLFSCTLILVSGVSGIGGTPTFDIPHHLQKVYDFSRFDLPMYYQSASGYASYYYGFYIVPGMLLTYFQSVTVVFFLWQWLGLFLGLFWTYLVLKRNFMHLVMLFLISGMLSFFVPILTSEDFLSSKYFYFKEQRWSLLPMYLSLRWVPNQFIYTLMVVGMILYLKPKHLLSCSTLLIAGLFWAPFPALTMGILLLFRAMPKVHWSGQLWGYVLLNSYFTAFVCLYLLANQTNGSLQFNLTSLESWLYYVCLIVFEILVFYFLTEKPFRERTEVKVTLALLLLLPAVKLGIGNDLFARASLPLLLVLYSYFVRSFSYASNKQLFRLAVMLMVALLPLRYMGYNISTLSLKPVYVPSHKTDTYQLIHQDYQSKKVADQYLMNRESLFYRFLLDHKPYQVLTTEH